MSGLSKMVTNERRLRREATANENPTWWDKVSGISKMVTNERRLRREATANENPTWWDRVNGLSKTVTNERRLRREATGNEATGKLTGLFRLHEQERFKTS